MSALRWLPLVALALVGCGSTTDNPSRGAGSVSASCPGTTDQDRLECEALTATNQARAQGTTCVSGPYPAVGPLEMSSALRTAARRHAEDMAKNDYLAHESRGDGRTVADRVTALGYEWDAVGENIAGGSPTAEGAIQQWLGSPDGHCELMMSSDYQDVGLGYAYDANSEYQHYWVMVLGSLR